MRNLNLNNFNFNSAKTLPDGSLQTNGEVITTPGGGAFLLWLRDAV